MCKGITLYNRFEDESGIRYRRQEIADAVYHAVYREILTDSGMVEDNIIKIRIPYRPDMGYVSEDGCDYINNWTIKIGDKIALGIKSSPTPDGIAAYTITEWADNTKLKSAAPHFRITAK